MVPSNSIVTKKFTFNAVLPVGQQKVLQRLSSFVRSDSHGFPPFLASVTTALTLNENIHIVKGYIRIPLQCDYIESLKQTLKTQLNLTQPI